MSQLAREKTEIPCPGGGRAIRTTYGDLSRKSALRSSKGHEYKFRSSDQSKFRRSMDKIERLQKDFERDMERAQKDFSETLSDVIGNADILLKR